MDPEIISKLAGLPLQLQVILAGGYCAYRLSYIGIRQHHLTADIAFASIAFGLVGGMVLLLAGPAIGAAELATAFAATLASGAIWRFWLARLLRWAIRKSNLSWSDDTPSAWHRITQDNRLFYVSQVTVTLKDGTRLHCNDTRRFRNAPFGPFISGPGGDVALYVTHLAKPGGIFVETRDVLDPTHGDEITLVAAAEITKLKLRQLARG